MSFSLVLAPVVIASWPAITAAVAGAAAAMGLAVKGNVTGSSKMPSQQQLKERSVEVAMNDSEVLSENVATGQEIVLTRGTIEIRVHRDERGRCSVCAKGIGHTEAELRSIAEEFTQKMTQIYMCNRVVTELKAKGFQLVNEEQMDDQAIRLHVRRWEA
jgi:hypothetical protein